MEILLYNTNNLFTKGGRAHPDIEDWVWSKEIIFNFGSEDKKDNYSHKNLIVINIKI